MITPPLIHYTSQYTAFLTDLLSCADESIRPRNSVSDDRIPLLVKNGVFGRVANSLPFFGSHGGPVVSDESDENRLALLHALEGLIGSQAYSSVTVVENPFKPLSVAEVNALSFLQEVDIRISQITCWPEKTEATEESLMSIFHQKTRNAIRKGLLRVGEIREATKDTEVFDFLVREHISSIKSLGGQPKERYVFESLAKNLPDFFRIHAAYTKENELASALLTLEYEQTVEYFTPVMKPEFRESQILSALIFKVMQQKFQNGFRYWNWGGTWQSQEGVYRFKNRFGARDFPYRYFHWCEDQIQNKSSEQLLEAYPYWYTRKF
jgi:hypothetical protein